MDVDEILSQVLVGSCPMDRDDVDYLKNEMGVTAVLNVQTDDDFDQWNIDWPILEGHYQDRGIEVCRVPVRDFSPETLRILLPNCVQALSELLDDGHKVLVHCTAGINRSPSTVIAYLHWVEQWDLDEAVSHVMQHRECGPYLKAIRLATEDRTEASGGSNRQPE